MTTSTKLLIGFGTLTALLILLVAAIVVRLQSVEAHIRTQADVARPRFGATREIEINVFRYALALRTYVPGFGPEQRERALEAVADVERHLADYQRFAVTARQAEMGRQFAEWWGEYRDLGKEFLKLPKGGFRLERGNRMKELRAEIESLLDHKMQPDAVAAFDSRKESTYRELGDVVSFALFLAGAGVVVAVLTSWAVGRGIVREERRALASEERYRAFIGQSSEGIWRMEFDPPIPSTLPFGDQVDAAYRNGRFAECNDEMARMSGMKAADELVGKSLGLMLPEADTSARGLLVSVFKAGYRATDAETIERGADGREFHFANSMTGVLEHDLLKRMWGMRRNISPRKQAEAALRDADRRKDEFLATLAHELRNPLAPLRHGLQILNLSERRSDGTTPQALAMMERQLSHMVRLIDDLLDVSRISRGKLDLQPQRVDLAVAIQNAIETSRPHLDANGQRLELRLPPEPMFLDADPARLAQIFANLLNNASKFMKNGGLATLVVEASGGDAVIRVKDDGNGIPPEMLERIFEPFTQVQGPLERQHGGLGVGLTLVKKLVELHGGGVEARSEGLGRGSEFTVRLPLASPGPSPMPIPKDEPISTCPSAKRRILVADDNVDAAGSLAEVLEYMGNEVRTANDGVQALEEAESFRPNVVLMDIGMPRMNGYDACRLLREQPWAKSISVIALTGWGQDEDRRRSKEAGFDVHLVKPVPARAISKVIEELDPVST